MLAVFQAHRISGPGAGALKRWAKAKFYNARKSNLLSVDFSQTMRPFITEENSKQKGYY